MTSPTWQHNIDECTLSYQDKTLRLHALDARGEVAEDTKDTAACLVLRRALDAHLVGGTVSPYKVPNTARKVVRMLHSLHTMGFASFA